MDVVVDLLKAHAQDEGSCRADRPAGKGRT